MFDVNRCQRSARNSEHRLEGVARKTVSGNKDSTMLVRRVESVFLIGAGACVSCRVRGEAG